MAEHLSMNTIIHAAVRRDLGRFTDALESFPVGSAQRARDLNRAWLHLDHQLYHHHHSEDTIFWPALVEIGADATLMTDLGAEHDRMAAAMIRTRTAMSALAADPSAANVEQATAAFVELADAVESHFVHEERDLDPFMIANLESPPMKRAAKQIRTAQSPVEAGRYLAWLQDGADSDARAFLGQQIPKPVLVILSRLLGRSYRKEIAPIWAAG
jgi:hypothetical protein